MKLIRDVAKTMEKGNVNKHVYAQYFSLKLAGNFHIKRI